MVKWRDIVNFEGLYQVSDEGQVKSFHKSNKGNILKPYPNSKGYPLVKLHGRHVRKHYFVHILVAEHHLPAPKKDRDQVNHKDGNPRNSRVSNLEWCTRKENAQHSKTVLGNYLEGEENDLSKTYEVTYPCGKKEIIVGLKAFCRKHDLHSGNMSSVATGNLGQYKGYDIRLLNDT